MPERIVIALGGNALQSGKGPFTAAAQLEVVKNTSERIAEISGRGYEIAIVHGNGPQIGRILLASEMAGEITPSMPFDVCGSMSQGYIGYHLQQAMRYALNLRNRDIQVTTVVTQVVVDQKDPAFLNPEKPIGPFYEEAQAGQMMKEKGYLMKEDAGRGWRRVVPSPLPKRIVEIETIKRLWDSTIVITCGGGGIPVIQEANGSLAGIAAVIDKDFAAGLLAEEVNADVLLILTEAEKVAIHYKTEKQQELDHLTLEQAANYIEEGHFAPGSMLPKVRAAMGFVMAHPSKKAIIASLDKGVEALEGKSGTVFTFA